jgi:hypothetical protein
MAGRDDIDRLIDLHIAEFAALTTRNTYLTNIAFTFFPGLIFYLTLVSIVGKGQSAGLMAGLAAFGSGVLALGWHHCIWEGYQNIRYAETILKPAVRELVQAKPERLRKVWNFEPWQDRFKGTETFRVLGDFWVLLIVLTLSIVLFWKYPSGDDFEKFVWVLSTVVLVVLLGMAWQVHSARRHFERDLRSLQNRMEAAVKKHEKQLHSD